MRKFRFLVPTMMIATIMLHSVRVMAAIVPVQFAEVPHGDLDLARVDFPNESVNDVVAPYGNKDQWFKFSLTNSTENTIEKVLFLDSPLAGKLTLYRGDQKAPMMLSGPGRALAERNYRSRLGAFSVSLAPHEVDTFYLHRDGHHALNAQLKWLDQADFEKTESGFKEVFFFYVGGIFCLVVYNILLGSYTRKVDYLLYSFFAASFCLCAMSLSGMLDTYLMPNSKIVFSNYLMFFSSLTLFAAGLFVERFLSIEKEFTSGYWGIRVVRGLALVSLLASLFAASNRNLFLFGYWIDISIALGICFFIYCGFVSLIRYKNPLAYFFLLSWCVVLIGTGTWMMTLHGLMHQSPAVKYALLFANLGEMLVLSLGLAYKIKILDREKTLALQDAKDKKRYLRLVRVLSHDVANTVSGVSFHAEMLKEKLLGVDARNHVDSISTSIGKLETLLNSVRREEVLHAARVQTDFDLVEVTEVCREVVNHFKWELREKGIEIKLSLSELCYVRADRSALANQVLSNLLSNAIKFSERGQTIEIACRKQDNFVAISVKDEGVGIHPEDLQHLFKEQKIISHKGTANESGTGMGTYLVSEYMKIFGGQIKVTSIHRSLNLSSGATVELRFPSIVVKDS